MSQHFWSNLKQKYLISKSITKEDVLACLEQDQSISANKLLSRRILIELINQKYLLPLNASGEIFCFNDKMADFFDPSQRLLGKPPN